MSVSRTFRRAVSVLRFSVLSVLFWALLVGGAKAAAESTKSGGSGKSWVISYLLIGLFVLLGLAAVLRPVNRTTDVKRTKED